MERSLIKRSLASIGNILLRDFRLQTLGNRFYSIPFRHRNPYLSSGKTISKMNQIDVKSPVLESMSDNCLPHKPIVWIDCEMTGLDHTKDHIIEICCIITDGELNLVDGDGYESVIHYDEKVMDSMNEWCVEHHGSSGLTEKVLTSTKTCEQVQEELLAYIKKFIPDERKGILAGNTVHMDRLFMLREFPKVIDYLFYRIIDVSSIMEVSFRHNPELAEVAPKKKTAHTAKSDILESIEQLRFYQTHYLKNRDETKGYVQKRREEIAQNVLEQESEVDGQNSAIVESSTKRRKVE